MILVSSSKLTPNFFFITAAYNVDNNLQPFWAVYRLLQLYRVDFMQLFCALKHTMRQIKSDRIHIEVKLSLYL